MNCLNSNFFTFALILIAEHLNFSFIHFCYSVIWFTAATEIACCLIDCSISNELLINLANLLCGSSDTCDSIVSSNTFPFSNVMITKQWNLHFLSSDESIHRTEFTPFFALNFAMYIKQHKSTLNLKQKQISVSLQLVSYKQRKLLQPTTITTARAAIAV